MRDFTIRVISLTVLVSPLLFGQQQTPVQRYQAAEKVFQTHSQGDFLHDDTAASIDALTTMWAASAQAASQVLDKHPDATAKDVDAALCQLLSSSGDCGAKDGARANVVSLGPHVFLASEFSGEAGTVFIVGLRDGRGHLLWSINSVKPQHADSRNLLSAWQAARAGGACRSPGSGHLPGTCGPLWADVGLLSPDSDGRSRFYVDAGYAQIMGATIAKQTSVWSWDGNNAKLLWIDLYDFMIDQRVGTKFANGILSIGEKEEFRSFYACGACEGRQVVERLRITPTKVVDLGKTSTTPELDLVDKLFWRLAKNLPTADIASDQVSKLLLPQIQDAKATSKKIDPTYFTTGMLMDTAITRAGSQENFCFTVDGDIGRLYFTLQTSPDGRSRIVHVTQPSGSYGDCPKQASRK